MILNFFFVKGLTPLYHACLSGKNPNVAELLLGDQAEIGVVDSQGWQEIHQVKSHTTKNTNKPISACVRMCYDILLKTSLLQVVNRLAASQLRQNLLYRPACCKLFQQVVTSLQMASYSKSDFIKKL